MKKSLNSSAASAFWSAAIENCQRRFTAAPPPPDGHLHSAGMRRVDGNVAVVGFHRRPLYVVMVALGPVDAPGLAEAFEVFPCRTSMRFWPEAPARLPWVGACELAAAEELDPDLAGNIHEAIVDMVRDLQMELERINRGN